RRARQGDELPRFDLPRLRHRRTLLERLADVGQRHGNGADVQGRETGIEAYLQSMAPGSERAERHTIITRLFAAREHQMLRITAVDRDGERRRLTSLVTPRAATTAGAKRRNDFAVGPHVERMRQERPLRRSVLLRDLRRCD